MPNIKVIKDPGFLYDLNYLFYAKFNTQLCVDSLADETKKEAYISLFAMITFWMETRIFPNIIYFILFGITAILYWAERKIYRYIHIDKKLRIKLVWILTIISSVIGLVGLFYCITYFL